jgi:hypothetical protein
MKRGPAVAIQISAEVVELADTPSQAAALLVICKFLIATLVMLNSITYPVSRKTASKPQ